MINMIQSVVEVLVVGAVGAGGAAILSHWLVEPLTAHLEATAKLIAGLG